jgi:2-succinyl-6-hydroxy-2,4-cyclohexadiene-1-carboxylate synthase
LGQASDWDSVGLQTHFSLDKPDLWSLSTSSLDAAGQELAQMSLPQTKSLLVGYSLGGRIALHAALARPEKYRALVVVSTHPGLKSESERQSRREADEVWAKRFESDENWETLMSDWNRQAVFNASAPRSLDPRGPAFNRSKLAAALRHWSLGTQADLRPALVRLPLPVLWICGGLDKKFTALAQDLTGRETQRLCIVETAGHRVPWDQPEIFTRLLRDFEESL